MSPALAAADGAAPAFGRMPLTEAMLTITPPVSCCCIWALARCATYIGGDEVQGHHGVEEAGETSATLPGGAPPALLTAMSSRP